MCSMKNLNETPSHQPKNASDIIYMMTSEETDEKENF